MAIPCKAHLIPIFSFDENGADRGTRIFPPGEKREHFLALATPEQVSGLRRGEKGMFKPASYEKESMILMGYDSSAAWTWLVCRRRLPRMLLYNDM